MFHSLKASNQCLNSKYFWLNLENLTSSHLHSCKIHCSWRQRAFCLWQNRHYNWIRSLIWNSENQNKYQVSRNIWTDGNKKSTFQNYAIFCHDHTSQIYCRKKKAVKGVEGPYTYNAATKTVPGIWTHAQMLPILNKEKFWSSHFSEFIAGNLF